MVKENILISNSASKKILSLDKETIKKITHVIEDKLPSLTKKELNDNDVISFKIDHNWLMFIGIKNGKLIVTEIKENNEVTFLSKELNISKNKLELGNDLMSVKIYLEMLEELNRISRNRTIRFIIYSIIMGVIISLIGNYVAMYLI